MDNRPNPDAAPNIAPDIAGEIAAAFAWWREAGVDRDFHDEPRGWLAGEEAPLSKSNQPYPREGGDFRPSDGARPDERGPRLRGDAGNVPPAPAIVSEDLPGDLAAFAQWWLSEPSLDGGRLSGRVPPRGSQGAKLMVLVAHPEREDEERLLSGPQGRLLGAMLPAMGIAPEEAYVAAALPRHTPHADWPAIAAGGMDAILRHHVTLAAPQRLLAFGGNILPLVSNDPAKNHTDLQQFNHESGSIPLLMDRDLAVLLERPGWKARFWTRWLDWTE